YWALRRAPWRPRPGDDWRCVADWAGVLAAIAPFARPLFTLGREPLAHLDEIPLHQHWLVRCLDAHEGNARARVLAARGPFSIDGERTLFATAAIDVVVSKNSGGAATEAKLEVARERRIPVVMVGRPALPDADREFGDTAALVDALRIFRAVGAHGAHRAFRAS
ncbi:precorrin-6A/cobalt-precorrin-6A reductase, partial [Burkholderia thailandensis]